MGHLNPYLSFENNSCREAMNFYKECLGGELHINTVSSMPEMAAQMPAHLADAILHAELRNGSLTLYGTDMSREQQVNGNTVAMCINCESAKELKTFFNNLAVGSKIIQPVGDMPWGAVYGELVDKYGKIWMFNFQK